jgi:hypothetical protein
MEERNGRGMRSGKGIEVEGERRDEREGRKG